MRLSLARELARHGQRSDRLQREDAVQRDSGFEDVPEDDEGRAGTFVLLHLDGRRLGDKGFDCIEEDESLDGEGGEVGGVEDRCRARPEAVDVKDVEEEAGRTGYRGVVVAHVELGEEAGVILVGERENLVQGWTGGVGKGKRAAGGPESDILALLHGQRGLTTARPIFQETCGGRGGGTVSRSRGN